MGFPGSSAGKKKKKKKFTCNVGDPYLIPGFGTSAGEGMDRLPNPVFLGFCGGSAGKDSACNAGDLSLIPGLAISPGRKWLPKPAFWPGEFQRLGLQRAGHD